MNYKVITNTYGAKLMEYIIRQGLINNGFDSIEELKESFPDTKLNITYLNMDKQNKIYALKNINTNEIVHYDIIEYLGCKDEQFQDKKQMEKLLKMYTENYKDDPDYTFLINNKPEDIIVTSYYIIEE